MQEKPQEEVEAERKQKEIETIVQEQEAHVQATIPRKRKTKANELEPTSAQDVTPKLLCLGFLYQIWMKN